MKLVSLAVLGLLLTSCVISDDYAEGDVYGTLSQTYSSTEKPMGWHFQSYTGPSYYYPRGENPFGVRFHRPDCSYEVHLTYRVNRNNGTTEFPRLLSAEHSGKNCPK